MKIEWHKQPQGEFSFTAGDINIYHARMIADQQITFVTELAGLLDLGKLENALAILHKALPILSTVVKVKEDRFQRIPFPEYQPSISIARITDNPQQEIVRFIGRPCDPECEPPLKVHLIRQKDRDTLCFKIDHTLSDAAGLRYLLSLFAEAYSTGNIAQPINHERGFGQVFHQFSTWTIFKATRKASLPIPGTTLLHGKFHGENTFIEHLSLDPDHFEQMKLEARRNGATVNDMLLAGLYQTVFKYINSDESASYPVMVPVDMRRYLPEGQRGVIANLSSAVYPSLKVLPNESFHGTLERVKACMDDFKRDQPGLGPMLLMSVGALFGGRMIKQRYQKAAQRGSRFINYTNFGVLERERFIFRGTPIEQIYGVGPIQYAPGVLIALSTYQNVLHFVVQGKGNQEFQAAIHQFLNEVVANLPK